MQTRLSALRTERASISPAGAIVALAVGVPATIAGAFLLSIASNEGEGVLSAIMLVAGVTCVIAGIVGIPVSLAKKSRLSREIRDTEDELRRMQTRSDVLLLPKPQQMLFSMTF